MLSELLLTENIRRVLIIIQNVIFIYTQETRKSVQKNYHISSVFQCKSNFTFLLFDYRAVADTF